MRHFCFSLIALLGLATIPLRGQSNDPADHFLHAYTAVKKGEKAEGSRDFRGAHAAYKQAVATLDQITARWPSWNPHIIKHRREKAGEGLTRVKPLMGKPGEQVTEEEVAGPLPGGDNLTLLPDESPIRELPPPSTDRRSSNGDPIAEIQNRLRQLQDDLRTTREKLERETAEKVELARKYDQAIKATEESARKQVIAEGRAQRAEDALVKAETDGVKSSEQLKTLRAEADAARKAVREIQIDREAGDELRQQFADRLANANKRMEALAQERDAARKDAADVPKRIAEMQKQLDSAVKEKGAISTKLAKVEGQLKLVTQERDDALIQISKMREAQKQVDKLLAENTTLMARLDDAQKTITRLNSESVKREDEIAILKRDVTTVKRQLADAKTQSTTYQQEMGELQSQLEAQAKDLALVKTNVTTTAAERKKLQQENDILRGIVIRQQKEQAIRDGKRKLVLTELGKLELNSKALVTQIEYLTSPVVKLTPRERKLFKQPIIEITDAEVAIAAPKEDAESEVEETAPSETASTASTASTTANPPGPTDPPIAEQVSPEKSEPVPPIAEKKEMAEAKAPTGAEPAPEATAPAEAAKVTAEATVSDVPAAPPASVPEVSGSNETLSLTAEGTAAPFELASAKTSGLLPSIPATKTAPEGDLPVKDKEEKKEGESAGAAPEVATTTTPNVPAELLPLARQGKEHFERNNYREAEKIYEKILAKAPNNLHALSNLGVVRFRSGKLKLAEEAFKKAIAVAPEDAFSHCTLGIVYYSQGKYDEAVNELTKAVAINPKNATAHNYLGITASQKGWQEAAQTELEAATALDPNYADAFFNLAVVFATQQPPNKESARKHYKRATELGAEPDSALEQLIK